MQIYKHTHSSQTKRMVEREMNNRPPPIVISACYIKISAYLARTNISVTNDLRVGRQTSI